MTEQFEATQSIQLVCSACGQVLSKPMCKFSGMSLHTEDQAPALPAGCYAISDDVIDDDEAFYGLKHGEVVVGLDDLLDVPPCGNRSGCCGPAGVEPNLKCLQGHIVGTEVGDCYQPHFVHLPLVCVRIVEGKPVGR